MIIRIQNLNYSYKKGISVLKDISIKFPEGKLITLVGPNGSGKTTLLKVMCGLLKTNSMIFADENPIDTLSDGQRAKLFSFVNSSSIAGTNISVLELLFLGIRASDNLKNWERRYSIVDPIMTSLGIHDLAFRKFVSLSSGQQQLTMIARALAQNPKILFLDEPLSNLDIKNQKVVLKILRMLANNNGMTTIAVLHDISQAVSSSDWIMGLKNGEVILSGKPKDCMTKESLMKLFGIEGKILKIEGKYVLVY